jgi:hypothetical protein
MSDHFVDPEYQKRHFHDPMGGTPHLEDEDDYRRQHLGRDVNLSDLLFEESYPTKVAPESIVTRPKCDY